MVKFVRTLTFLAAATFASSTLAANPAAAATNGKFQPTQVKQIEQIIHDYIVNNPQVLVEASQALRAKEMAKAQEKAQSAISANTTSLFKSADSPTMGSAEANAVVVEFLDYQCGHCKRMSPILTELLNQDKDVKVVIKVLPIFGSTSDYAARAAHAAAMQGIDKFKAFHTGLLEEEKPLSNDSIIAIATKAGLDIAKLKQDMETDNVKTQLKDNFRLAQEIGLLGTPAFVVGNADGSRTEFIPGAANKQTLVDAIKKIRG